MENSFGRRDFGKIALAGVPLASTLLAAPRLFAQAKPNSRINGVQIGAITSSFNGMAASEIMLAMLKIGLSEVELQSTHAEALAGAPAANRGPGRGRGANTGPRTLNADGLMPRCANLPMVILPPPSSERAPQTPEQEAAQKKLWEWRASTTPETWQGVRKQFTDAGIDLRILWYGLRLIGAPVPSDEELDYVFQMAKGLGVRAISSSCTIPTAKRIVPVAAKYKIPWGGHTADNVHDLDQFVNPDVYEELLSFSPYFRINLDLGYFTAAGFDAIPYIKKNHAKITDIHLKDRKRSKSLGGDITDDTLNNWPWGQGDSPIREVLQLLKKEKYDISCNIEYEYSCRTTEDAVTEIGKCYEYAKMCLA